MADLHGRLVARIGPADLVKSPYLYLDALEAVLDKCRQMRSTAIGVTGRPTIVGEAIAAEFERVIAEALGMSVEEPAGE